MVGRSWLTSFGVTGWKLSAVTSILQHEYIFPGTYVEFVMEYLTTNGRRILIIGQSYINGSVQFTGFPEVWGSSMPYIYNDIIPDTNRGSG